MRAAAVLSTIALACLFSAPAAADTTGNVRTAKRVFLENMATGRFDDAAEIYGPGFVAHGASFKYNLEQDEAATRSWREAMPDLKVTVERTVGDKDLVAVHWLARGTNTVAAGGMPGKGDHLNIEGMTFFRFTAGRIVEEWSIVDVVTLRNLLGQPAAPP